MEHDGCTFCPMFKAPMGFVTMRADSFMNGDGVRSTEYMCSPGGLSIRAFVAWQSGLLLL